MKIRSVGGELFYADRQKDGETGMAKLIVTFFFFCNFANAPNKPEAFHIG